MPCSRKFRRSFYLCWEDVLEYERIKNRINEWRKERNMDEVKEYEIFHVMLELFKNYGIRRFADLTV
ncbi:hypothetical protein DRO29_08040 [Candidatus Bathyarchaeota archaeon]|nr:MAG: hypothetical protein DRO29_08040 [Candidatus Bathyarchaeota archaeon]